MSKNKTAKDYELEILALKEELDFFQQEKPSEQWIKVSDRLPEFNISVLVWIKSKNRIEHEEQRQITYYTNDGWCHQYGELMNWDDESNITHWMPLPQKPKEL